MTATETTRLTPETARSAPTPTRVDALGVPPGWRGPQTTQSRPTPGPCDLAELPAPPAAPARTLKTVEGLDEDQEALLGTFLLFYLE